MSKAAAIIAALLEGKPALVVERRTGMVHGWGLWMRALPERLGTISGAAANAIIEVLRSRPPRTPPRAAPALGRWQAARSLFYQDWDPPLPEERGLRWFAGSVSVLMHVLFVLVLLYIAMMRLPPPPAAEDDGSRMRVEFIGGEVPAEGGAPSAGEPAAAAPEPAVAEQPVASEPAAVALSTPRQEQPQPAAPAAEQILQVTETETPTTDFVLPPPTPRTPEFVAPQITPPELGVPTREVRIVQVPPAQRRPPVELDVPAMEQPQVTVREREIAAPAPTIRRVEVPRPAVQAPVLDVPVPEVRQVEIASPTPTPARASGPAAPAAAPVAGRMPASPADQAQEGQVATQVGSGAEAPRTGGAPAVRRGDDWGALARDGADDGADGKAGAPGLFNADGSVRLPGDGIAGKATQAGPPGSRQAQRADADRASKWLERPAYPYEPTMFDKFWVPNESLLAEWVRRNIEEVEIPIPGTSKKVKCVVSILQLGGACALSDPNLNEQPAGARPPPDIPVKRNPIPVDS